MEEVGEAAIRQQEVAKEALAEARAIDVLRDHEGLRLACEINACPAVESKVLARVLCIACQRGHQGLRLQDCAAQLLQVLQRGALVRVCA